MKILAFFLGGGSSLVFVGFGGYILVLQPEHTIETLVRMSRYTLFFFLVAQGLLVQVLKGQEENRGMLDLLASIGVLLAVVLVIPLVDHPPYWWEIWSIYAFGALYDALINNRMILRMFRMSTGVAQEGAILTRKKGCKEKTLGCSPWVFLFPKKYLFSKRKML